MNQKHSDPGQALEQGIAAQRAGQFAEAEKIYLAILAAVPGHFEARYMLGLVFLQRNQFDLAERTIGEALAFRPGEAGAEANRALALFHLGRFAEAAQSCDRALHLNPALVGAHIHRAKALQALRRNNEALASFDRALALHPQNPDVWFARGTALLSLGRAGDALASFDRAVALNPNHVQTLSLRGFTLESLKRYDEAAGSYDRAYALNPDEAFLEGARLHARMHVCDWRNFDQDCARLLAHVNEGQACAAPFALLPIASNGQQQRRSAEEFVALRTPPSPQALWNGERYNHAKIRIAYLSASLIQHPVGILAAGLFERHDRSRFETFALSFSPDDGSAIRKRLMAAFDHFIAAEQTSDHDIARWIRQNEIDIAIDLDGYTTNGRTEILSFRPTPIQAHYLGYPSTLGASYIDYVIGDAVVMPPEAEMDFVEKIVRLPHSYLPNTERGILGAPPPRPSCGLPEQGIVFCCFNNAFKITPDVFAAWMRLLRATPASVLWLRDGGPLVQDNLFREAEKHGIAPDRFVFAAHTPTLDDHFARHQLADIFLDTLYYNAHTTAADALWCGVPVVTCLGSTFAARVGASLLHAVGLAELVTHTLVEYEALALELANDPSLLSSFKNRLNQNRATAPLFDVARTTRHLEAAYITMLEVAHAGKAPESFSVPR